MAKVGDLVGGTYRVVRTLGSGGMGEVCEAVHERIGKRVAVKTLRAALVGDARVAGRFLREARAAAAVGHPAIVDVYDHGVEPDGSHFIVMELLHGESLGDRLDVADCLDLPTAAFVSCQVLSALSAAHGAGVLHRDVKPGNIYLQDVGAPLPEVKLFDFGISRVQDQAFPDSGSSLTRTGLIVGTPAYMSPEHARGAGDLDHRADIYAVGVTLYQCLTGRTPFAADNYHALLLSIINDEPPSPSALRPDLPEKLTSVVLRAMAKRREDRYQDALEMLRDLLPFVDELALARVHMPKGAEGLVDLDAARERLSRSGQPPRLDSMSVPPSTGEDAACLSAEQEDEPLLLPAGARHRTLIVALAATALLGGAAVGIVRTFSLSPESPPHTVPVVHDRSVGTAVPTPHGLAEAGDAGTGRLGDERGPGAPADADRSAHEDDDREVAAPANGVRMKRPPGPRTGERGASSLVVVIRTIRLSTSSSG